MMNRESTARDAASEMPLANPYCSPTATLGDGDEAEGSKHEQFGRMLCTWEKLRLYYNLIGAMPTLLLVLMRPGLFVELCGCALIANVSYCAGPVANLYLMRMGMRGRAVTYLLFVAGTCLTLLLAGGFVLAIFAGSMLPNQP